MAVRLENIEVGKTIWVRATVIRTNVKGKVVNRAKGKLVQLPVISSGIDGATIELQVGTEPVVIGDEG